MADFERRIFFCGDRDLAQHKIAVRREPDARGFFLQRLDAESRHPRRSLCRNRVGFRPVVLFWRVALSLDHRAHHAVLVRLERDVLLRRRRTERLQRLPRAAARERVERRLFPRGLRSGEFRVRLCKFRLQRGEPPADVRELFPQLCVEHRDAILAPPEDRLLDVRKKCAHRIEVALRPRIELVIMALSAAGRLPHPRRADRAHTIREHPHLVILRLRAAFLRREQQPVERRSHARLLVCTGHEVARDLLDGEAVESLVVIETLDHPVAIRPNVARIVRMVADRVRKAHHIEPSDRHALAVVRAREHALDELRIRIRRLVRDERRDLLRLRRKPEQIGVEPADQSAAIRLRRGLQSDLREPLLHESVNGIADFPRRRVRRDVRFHRLLIRPMPLIFRTLRDPLFEDLLLPHREFFVRLRRRHQLVLVRRENAFHEFARLGFPRHERFALQRLLADVEPQLCLAVLRIVAVAVEAVIREDRPHIAVEFDLRRQRRIGGARDARGKQTEKEGFFHGGHFHISDSALPVLFGVCCSGGTFHSATGS